MIKFNFQIRTFWNKSYYVRFNIPYLLKNLKNKIHDPQGETKRLSSACKIKTFKIHDVSITLSCYPLTSSYLKKRSQMKWSKCRVFVYICSCFNTILNNEYITWFILKSSNKLFNNQSKQTNQFVKTQFSIPQSDYLHLNQIIYPYI